MCQYTRFPFTDLYFPVNGMPVCCNLHIKISKVKDPWKHFDNDPNTKSTAHFYIYKRVQVKEDHILEKIQHYLLAIKGFLLFSPDKGLKRSWADI